VAGDTKSRKRALSGCAILVVEDEPLTGARASSANAVAAALTLIDGQALSAAVVDFRSGADGAAPAVKAMQERGVPYDFYTGDNTDTAVAGAPVIGKLGRMQEIVTHIACPHL
jgi:hypothetical protein